MLYLRLTLPVCFLAVCVFTNVTLGVEVFRAIMTTAAEVPAPTLTHSGTGQPRPASFGSAIFVLSDDESFMTMTARIRNIDITGLQTPDDTNDNLVNAHIHASDTVTPSTTAGVVWGFFGAPDHDNNPDDLVVIPFTNSVGGVFTSKWDAAEGVTGGLAAQLTRIRTGRAYINFHTVQNGPGEIRGFLQLIPEPSSAVLSMFAAAMLTFRRGRR
jgi:hypothetical protein